MSSIDINLVFKFWFWHDVVQVYQIKAPYSYFESKIITLQRTQGSIERQIVIFPSLPPKTRVTQHQRHASADAQHVWECPASSLGEGSTLIFCPATRENLHFKDPVDGAGTSTLCCAHTDAIRAKVHAGGETARGRKKRNLAWSLFGTESWEKEDSRRGQLDPTAGDRSLSLQQQTSRQQPPT